MPHMSDAPAIGRLGDVVLDCPDPAALARFYQALLGLVVVDSDDSWVTLGGGPGPTLSFQRVERYLPPRWPSRRRAQQLHLDVEVTDLLAADAQARAAGARPLTEVRSTGSAPWRVYADPAGHPFCLVTAKPESSLGE